MVKKTIIVLLFAALITTAAGSVLCFADSEAITVPQREYSVADTQKPFELNVKSDGGLVYASDDTDVVTVSRKGRVTVRGTGKAKITVSAKEDPTQQEIISIRVSEYKKTSGMMAESDWNYDKKPGDSSGDESAVFKYEYRPSTDYYHWNFIIRCNDPQVADKAATAVNYIVNNNNFGYESIKPTSQKAVRRRGSIYRAVVKVTGKNPTKAQLKKIKTIKTGADASCLPTILSGYWLYYDMSEDLSLKWMPPYDKKSYKYSFGEVNIECEQLEKAVKQVNKDYRKAGKLEPFTIIYISKSRQRSFFSPGNIKNNLKRGDIICSFQNPRHEGHTAMMM